MTLQPTRDRLDRTPFWQVQAVFGSEDEGPGFAYTIGLHAHGLPELHLWAQPDCGDDPGADWSFGCRDEVALLNRFAWRLVDGAWGPGDEFSETFDGGGTTVRFRVGTPGDRLALEAFGTDDDAIVLPVHWSLHRPPAAPAVPLDRDALIRICAEVTDLEIVLDHTDDQTPDDLPEPWRSSGTPRFDQDQVFGPRTSLVRLRASQLWRATPEAVARLLDHGALMDEHDAVSHGAVIAFSLARQIGRQAATEAVQRELPALLDWYTRRPGTAGIWDAAVAQVSGEAAAYGVLRHQQSVVHAAQRLLYEVTLSCLMVETVADVIDPQGLCHARGPWLAALQCEPGELPGPEWQASPHVLDAIGELLTPLPARALMELAQAHLLAVFGPDADPEYQRVTRSLRTWTLVGGADCAWSPTLERLPGWTDVLRPLGLCQPDGTPVPHVTLGALPELHGWARLLASALTHRARLSAEAVGVFARPVAAILPDLEGCLNTLR